MKKTVSGIMLIVVSVGILAAAFNVHLMPSASALYKPAESLPKTSVFSTPSRINGTTTGQTVTVYINATNYVDVDMIQIGLMWSNTTVAQCTSVALGNIFSSYPSSDVIGMPGTLDNTNGMITYYAWSLVDSYNVTGSGTLAVFTFTIEHPGYADLHIIDLELETVQNTMVPTNLIDYFTVVRGGYQYIVKVQGNPSQSWAVPPDNSGFYGECVAPMSPTTVGGASGLVGNLTFAINGTSMDNGAFGYFNVTIPDNLMNCSGNNANWVVELNTGTGPVLEPTRTVSSGTGTTTISLSSAHFYPSGEFATSIVNIYSTNMAVFSVAVSPSLATLDVGQSKTFTASVSDDASPYSYQWYLNGAAVSGATSASWTFTPSSTGSYAVYVKVTDNVGMQATSNTATVTANGALSVTISPTSAGTSETFTATVTGGTSPFNYQWYLNGVAVSGATSASWTFTPSSAGSYSVYATVTDNARIQATSNTASATFVPLTLSANMTVPNLAFTIVNSQGQTVGTYGPGGVVLLQGTYQVTASPTEWPIGKSRYLVIEGVFVGWSGLSSQRSATTTITLTVNGSLTAGYTEESGGPAQ